MKYFISYRERAGGSHEDYERVQERVLALMQTLEMPASIQVEQFVSVLGTFGGYLVVSTETPSDIHLLTMIFSMYECKVEPVLDLAEALPVEMQAVQYRKRHGSPAAASSGSA